MDEPVDSAGVPNLAIMLAAKAKKEAGGPEPMAEDAPTEDAGLLAACEDFAAAFEAKDTSAMAEALRNAFTMMKAEERDDD